MKKILITITSVMFFFYAQSDIPEGYYSNAEGLSQSALRTALHNIIDDHTVKTYGDARYILDDADQDPNNSSNIILVYTGHSTSSSWDAGETWNREHVWSKSHGFPNESDIPYSDLHNLKPSHPEVNEDRSDKDFDKGDTQHSIATGCYYTSTSWEPRDEVKGDIARIMFYMIVRYEGSANGEPDLELVDEITSFPDPEFGVFSTLLKWHYDDPVDDFERNRNDIIYSHQKNRNPFIDHPEYVSKLWGGGGTNPAPTISNVSNIPEIPSDSEDVNITATITDDGNIVSAEMRWGLISGALLDTITMTNTSGDQFSTSIAIPAHNNGNVIYFEVAANDDSSGTSVSDEYEYKISNNPPDIIIDQKFTSCPASGWTVYSVSGSEDWECSDYGYMHVNAYDGDDASDDWFISPGINLDLYNEEYLTFKSWTKYTDTSYPTIELKYSTDYTGSGDPNNATWGDLSANWSAEDSETWTNSGEIDLSTITGTNVYIAFRYTSSGTASEQCAIWEIDDIYLAEKSNAFPEISSINHSPENPTESESIAIHANIIDSDGSILSADIKWGTSSGNYPNTVAMTNIEDDYLGEISAQTGGTFIYYLIEATDNDSETKQSVENMVSINTNGNSIPTISDVSIDPEMPGSSSDVIVIATIADSDGSVTHAKLKWGIETGKYPYTMDMNANGDQFSSFIPSRGEDTHIYFVTEAYDSDGGFSQSSEHNYIINNAPEISNVAISPENPTNNDNIIVSANISDANGTIESATLQWKTIEAASYTDISMSLSGSVYEATIPLQESGDSIVFNIIAADNYGKQVSYTSSFGVNNATIVPAIVKSNISIYPNPASELVNISLSKYSGETEVYIYSLGGKCIVQNSLKGAKNHQVSVNGIDEGVYIIKIKQQNDYYTQKLIIR